MPQSQQRLQFIADSSVGVGPIKTVAGTTYTFELADVNRYIRFTNAGAITATIPLNSVTPFPLNKVLTFEQAGAGAVMLVGAGGVTINSVNAALATAAQFSVIQAIKVGADAWTAFGNLA